MTSPITLATLLEINAEVASAEAVAVAQQLLSVPSDTDATPPYGPLTLETVAIDRDGSVLCLHTAATPSVSEVALVLQTLLNQSQPRTTGGLRYTLGRALLEVEAPPFDTNEEFSEALTRFESGDRREQVARLYARVHARSAGAIGPIVTNGRERRRHEPSSAELRRHLREADLRLYEARQAHAPAGAAERSKIAKAPLAACMLAGVALVAVGEYAYVSTGRAPVIPSHQPIAPGVAILPSIPAGVLTFAEEEAAPVASEAPPAAKSPRQQAKPVAWPPKGRDAADARVPRSSAAVAVPATPERPAPAMLRVQSTGRPGMVVTRMQPSPPARTQDAVQHKSDRKPSDRGVLARIRFEWNDPFK